MESEGTSALQNESGTTEKNNIIPFPKTEIIKPLPSEKADPFIPHERPADLATLDFLLWLPKGTSGFKFETDKALPKGPNKYDGDSAEAIKSKSIGQMKFRHGNLAKEALDKYRSIEASDEDKKVIEGYMKAYAQGPDKAAKLLEGLSNPSPKILAFIEYEKARKNYMERVTPEVGVRNVRLMGDVVKIDSIPVDFQVNAAIGNIGQTQENLERGALSATSGNVIFAPDKSGQKRLGLMIRSDRNNRWRNVPGALIAGYFDGNLNEKPSKLSPNQGRRTLQTIDNNAIFANGYKELHEEIGVGHEAVKKASVVGLAVEKKDRIHHEILMDAELKLTAEQAQEKSKAHNVEIAEEFPEKWIDIECSPEAIVTLLTKVLSPLPTGHLAAFAATGRRLVAERSGEKAAKEYMDKLSLGILEHNERMNGIVREYIRNNPDVLTKPTALQQAAIDKQTDEYMEKNPQATLEDIEKFRQNLVDKRAKFNPDGFTPELTPEEQGLPNVYEALRMEGLITDNVEAFPQKQAKAA